MAEVAPLLSVNVSWKETTYMKGMTMANKTMKIRTKKEVITKVTTTLATMIKATTTKAIMMTVTVEDTATVDIMVATMDGVEGSAEEEAEDAL